MKRRPNVSDAQAAKKSRSGKQKNIAQALRDGDRLLNLEEVSQIMRHKKTWLYDKIKERKFPEGYKYVDGEERFWLLSEVQEAMGRLLVPATNKKIGKRGNHSSQHSERSR
jgi:predicted DNA-binding transcriptional regulator AlpA